MPNQTPSPVFPQGANPEAVYEYVAWPTWFTSPDGTRRIFNNREEVPEGWMTKEEYAEFVDAGVEDATPPPGEPAPEQPKEPTGEELARELTADQRKKAINDLVDDNQHDDLVAMLELMNIGREDEIEYAISWPKAKLATTIIDNGGPPDAEAE